MHRRARTSIWFNPKSIVDGINPFYVLIWVDGFSTTIIPSREELEDIHREIGEALLAQDAATKRENPMYGMQSEQVIE